MKPSFTAKETGVYKAQYMYPLKWTHDGAVLAVNNGGQWLTCFDGLVASGNTVTFDVHPEIQLGLEPEYYRVMDREETMVLWGWAAGRLFITGPTPLLAR